MPEPVRSCLRAALLAALLPVPPALAQEETGASGDERSVRRLGDMVGGGEDEFSMDIPELAVPPVRERPGVRLPDPGRDGRLQALLDRWVASGPGTGPDREVEALMNEVRRVALADIEAGDLVAARARQAVLARLAPALGVQAEIDAAVAARTALEPLREGFEEALAAGRLATPEAESALDWLEQLRAADTVVPDLDALEGRLRAAMLARIEALLENARLEPASDLVERLTAVGVSADRRAAFGARVAQGRGEQIARLREQFEQRLAAVEVEAAAALLERLAALAGDGAGIQALQARLSRVRRYGGYRPGEVFADPLPGLGTGPEMIVIPSGRARLGSPPSEAGRFADEGPRFEVAFARGFALARTEVTVAQFRLFVQATGYRGDAERRGHSNIFDVRVGSIVERRNMTWQNDFRGNRAGDDEPVTHVSFNDARAYAAWLGETAGKAYRLPSEAEFEYALRGGSQTRYWWGDAGPDRPVENLAGGRDRLAGDQRWTDAFAGYRDDYWGPAPVGSFSTNPYGLYDIGGNQLEWVADCWFDSYIDPPVDGRARGSADCERRVLRGGAWSNGPRVSRSAYRLSGRADFTDARVGFRVARDLVSTAAASEG